MRTDDPWEAAQKAIAWAKQDRLDLKSKKQEQAQQDEQSLAHYCPGWHANPRGVATSAVSPSGYAKTSAFGLQRDTIQHQPFAKKSC